MYLLLLSILVFITLACDFVAVVFLIRAVLYAVGDYFEHIGKSYKG